MKRLGREGLFDLGAFVLVPAKQYDMPASAGFAPTGVYHPVGSGFAHRIAGLPTGGGYVVLPLRPPWDRRRFLINSERFAGDWVAQITEGCICKVKWDYHTRSVIWLEVDCYCGRSGCNAGGAVKSGLLVVMKPPLRVDHPAKNTRGVSGKGDPVKAPRKGHKSSHPVRLKIVLLQAPPCSPCPPMSPLDGICGRSDRLPQTPRGSWWRCCRAGSPHSRPCGFPAYP